MSQPQRSRQSYRRPIKPQRHKPQNPQKSSGAIRWILGVLLVLFVVNLLVKKNSPSQVEDMLNSSSEQKAVHSSKKSKRSTKSKKTSQKKKPAVYTRPKDLSFNEVKLLLSQKPPTLKSSVDTVSWRGHRLIRYFSLDTLSQQRGEIYMRRYHPRYGAAVIMQARTGRVLGLISYNNPEDPFESEHLYGKAFFPAASVAKVITVAAVLEKGRLTPSSQISITGKNYTLYKNQYAVNPTGAKRNISVSNAFAKSINPAFARLGIFHAGRTALAGSAQKFGFNTTIPFELALEKTHYQVPLDTPGIADISAGFNQETVISPMLGALLAGAVSNEGKMIRPTLVDSIVPLKDSLPIYVRIPQLWRIATTPKVASQLEEMMHQVTKKGSARKSFANIKKSRKFNSYSYGGKTGSVDKKGYGRVNWFVGFLKDSTDANKHLSIGVVQIHGATWMQHSSFIAGEMLRYAISDEEKRQKRVALELQRAKEEAEALKQKQLLEKNTEKEQ